MELIFCIVVAIVLVELLPVILTIAGIFFLWVVACILERWPFKGAGR